MSSHADVRRGILAGSQALYRFELNRSAAQHCGAISCLETNNGEAWNTPEGKASFNLGAIQATKPPCDPKTAFPYRDTHPTADGKTISYPICFRSYATLADGARNLVRTVFGVETASQKSPLGIRFMRAMPAAMKGDTLGFSRALHDSRYYEGAARNRDGSVATFEDRIQAHARAVTAGIRRIARALGEPLPDGTPAPARTLMLGLEGDDVREWQNLMHVPVSGVFDELTVRRTEIMQAALGLDVDGKVGPKTRAALPHYQPPPVDASDPDHPEPPHFSDLAVCRGFEGIPFVGLDDDYWTHDYVQARDEAAEAIGDSAIVIPKQTLSPTTLVSLGVGAASFATIAYLLSHC